MSKTYWVLAAFAAMAAIAGVAGCDKVEELLNDGGGEADTGGGESDAGGGGGDTGGVKDTGSVEDTGGGTGDGGGIFTTLPYIDSVSPANGAVDTEATIVLTGQNFKSGATVYFNDAALAGVTFTDATSMTAVIPASATANPGQYQLYVENTPGDGTTRSNVAYFMVNQAAGAPSIVDYSPDNGIEGDTILVIGENLSGEDLKIADPAGKEVVSNTFGTISVWGGSKETAEFKVAAGWKTGQITIKNSKGAFVGKIFNVGQNLTVMAGSVATASSEFSSTWPIGKGSDNKLETSWFSKNGDCATSTSCTTVPWFTVTFAADHSVGRIAMRGNREYESGYDFIKGSFEILNGAGASVWGQSFSFPAPDRDLDINVNPPVTGRAVKFTSLEDESVEPGFAELEVFEP